MADKHIANINDKWALGYDNLQWVLRRRTLNEKTGEEKLTAMNFVRSTRAHLFGVMVRRKIPKDDALAVCEKLPETFTEFLAEINEPVTGDE